MTTWREFADRFKACKEGYEWAEASGCSTMAEVWARDDFPAEFRIWCAVQPGVLTDKELRLFAVWCARQVQHLMEDECSLHALDVAERYANGEATDEELTAAGAAAWAAAGAAAWAAAGAAASVAAGAAAWDAQAQYLIQNTSPDWDRAMKEGKA